MVMMAETTRNHGQGMVRMAVGDLLVAERMAGSVARCASGMVWLTVEGDGADHVMIAGQSVTIRGDGRVVIEALSDARVELVEVGRTLNHERL